MDLKLSFSCELFNIQVIIFEEQTEQSFEQTLAADVIEIMPVFCAKLYGKHSHKNKHPKPATLIP